jgi:hypothetical protein
LKRLGYEKPQSARCAFVRFFSATFLRRATLSRCFNAAQKRQLQPERYMTWGLKLVGKYGKNNMKMGIDTNK